MIGFLADTEDLVFKSYKYPIFGSRRRMSNRKQVPLIVTGILANKPCSENKYAAVFVGKL